MGFLILYIMFTVYVLFSEKYNKIYIGYTSNIEQRFLSHNELSKKGYTIRYRPWLIAYTEEFETKSEAIKREKQLKTSPFCLCAAIAILSLSMATSYPKDSSSITVLEKSLST